MEEKITKFLINAYEIVDKTTIERDARNDARAILELFEEEIITWSRTHHTGNIDELYEVNLSDLLRFISSPHPKKEEVGG